MWQFSEADAAFQHRFESGAIKAGTFDHRSHLRLAYIYLCSQPPDAALPGFSTALQRFLQRVGAPPEKFHVTLTAAWLQAVWHYMHAVPDCTCADEFLEQATELLDPAIMASHYSPKRLWSDAARRAYLTPDRAPIPQHAHGVAQD